MNLKATLLAISYPGWRLFNRWSILISKVVLVK